MPAAAAEMDRELVELRVLAAVEEVELTEEQEPMASRIPVAVVALQVEQVGAEL
jgi:hypothetical protein